MTEKQALLSAGANVGQFDKKFFSKTIDSLPNLMYNKGVPREGMKRFCRSCARRVEERAGSSGTLEKW